MDRKKFLEERKGGLGGSDISALFNLEFGCRRALEYDKCGIPEDFQKTGAALERGEMMEPVIRQMYERKTGRETWLIEQLQHPQFPWMRVHMDAVVKDPLKIGDGYAEFKSCDRWVMRQFKQVGVRQGIILQVQHGLAVSGLKWGSFGILCLDPWEFQWFDVERDEAIISELIREETYFWNKLEAEKAPSADILPEKDKRCYTCSWRRTCKGEWFLSQIPKDIHVETIELMEAAPLVEEWAELSQLSKEIEELLESTKEEVKVLMAEHLCITVPGARVLTSKWSESRWDSKALAALEAGTKWLIGNLLVSLVDANEETRQIMATCAYQMNLFLKCRKPPTPKSKTQLYITGD